MRIITKLPFTLLIISVILISCQKEIKYDIQGGTPGTVINSSPVSASLTGKIIDENNNPVTGALVRSGTNVMTTDSRGLFRFNNIQLDKYTSLVTVEKNGYYRAYRVFAATENNTNFIKLKLIPRTNSGNIDASAGGSVTLGDNSQIALPAGSVVIKSTNQPYTGSIKVYATPIDPTASDIAETVPGSFQGNNDENYRVLLKSFAMLAVELEGSSGEALQIANGKKAVLKFSIPAALRSTSPSSIPLWYVDESTGLWQEQGTATRNGNFYEGEVSHFSFWNCDINIPTIHLQMTIVTTEGSLPFTKVKITRVNGGGASYGYTDSSGRVGGLVLKNEPLLLEVFSNCNQPIYSQNIGPFSSNTNLGTITVTIPAQNTLQITGSAVNCSSQPVTSGNALIYFDGHLYHTPLNNGSFTLTITRCSNSSAVVEVIVIDNTANQQSSPWNGTAASGTVNTGTISACGTSSVSSINYVLDGTNFSLSSATPGDSITAYGSSTANQNATFISGFRVSQPNIQISLYTQGTAVGTFPLQHLSVNQFDSVTIVTPFNITFTAYGAPSQFIEGNFSGQIREVSNNNLHNVSATFRVRRR